MATQGFVDMLGDIKMPSVGLGTWQVTDEKELELALNTALEAGYRHIDTAFIYQNEAIVGRVLNKWFSSGKLKREDVFVTTKLPMSGVHEDRVENYMKKSLDNLQLDYVDLYLIHFPICFKMTGGDPRSSEPEKTDHISVWKKMEEQVDAGRTKTIGLSNFNIRQINRIRASARIQPSCLQVELHAHLQQKELVQYCHQNKIVVVAFSPLGCPAFNKFQTSIGREPAKLPDLLHDPVITRIAEKHKRSAAQILLRYLLQKDIVVIPKSVTPNRIKENIDVFNFTLDQDDEKAVGDLDKGDNARIFGSYMMKGLSDHPEWPYPK